MVREINIDSIRALEKQIEEHERAIIRLKRARNSLLNVSTLLPPEILGNIFRWNVIPDGDFGGLSKGSYNFLLVCHHWFEVASGAPGLWCFWGTSIEDWRRRYARCRTGPVDLVLEKYQGPELDDELRDALQDCAARDAIQRVHFKGFRRAESLNSFISSIITEGEETRLNSMESFIVQNSRGSDTVDVSSFFSRYHLPKLQCLRLVGFRISSWDLLKSRTTALTILELTANGSSPIPTLSQLLSILSSNPLLQDFALSYGLVDGERSFPLVPLRHLKKLRLSSDFRHAFTLINQLELPDKMKNLNLRLRECSPSDLSQTLGPYLRDRIQHRDKFPGRGLGLLATHSRSTFRLCTGDAHKCDKFSGMAWFMAINVIMKGILGEEEAERIGFDLITTIPREQVVNLQTTLPILRSEELCVEMCDLTYLRLHKVDLSTWFVEPDIPGSHAYKELLPSLDRIVIAKPSLSEDWSPFTDFLSRRAAVGNKISFLRLGWHPPMDGDVVDSIEDAVKIFEDEGDDDYELYDHSD